LRDPASEAQAQPGRVGDDVVQPGPGAFDNHETGGDKPVAVTQGQGRASQCQCLQPLQMCSAVVIWRATQSRDDIDPLRQVQDLDTAIFSGRRLDRHGLNRGGVELWTGPERKFSVQARRLGKRRHAKDQRQAAFPVKLLAMRQLVGQRQARRVDRIDRARPLYLARQHPQQPTVVQQLLGWRRRIQAQFFQAAQIGAAAHHGSSRHSTQAQARKGRKSGFARS